MVANQLRRQPLSFAASLKLSQQTFAHVARSAADRFESHDNRPRELDRFFGPATLDSHFFVSSRQPAVFIKIPYHTLGCFADLALRAIHVEAPFQMLRQGRSSGKKLLERG